MKIAVGFDGTIVEHRYPRIGREKPFAIDMLKRLQEEGHQLILWSIREGILLDKAVEYCNKRGLKFYAVNSNFIEELRDVGHFTKKIEADLFIDDCNIGGLPDWGTIYTMIHHKLTYEDFFCNLDFKTI